MTTRIPADNFWKATGKTLGGGGQSSVERVEPREGGGPPGPFAMKILRNAGSKQARARFLKEIAAIKLIEDSRIVQIVDHHQDKADFLFYVMRTHDKLEPLNKLIFDESSPFKKNAKLCLEFIAECAEALDCAHVHESKIVHRDIQPANVLLNLENNKPLIIDFGCCQIDGDETITLVDEAVGTKDYMAPECESGAHGEADARSDLYSLGKLLWALVTGLKAFSRENPAFNTRNLSTVLPAHPDCWHLTRIFERTIRRNVKDRYSNAAEMAQECRRFASRIVNRFPPLELVQDCCPACGQGKLFSGNGVTSSNLPLNADAIFSTGGHMQTGVVGLRCGTCGYILARDERLLKQRNETLKSLE